MSAILLSENFPPKVGGSGRWFWELYRRLPSSEFLIVAGSDPGEKEFDEQHDLRLERVPLSFSSRLVRPRTLPEYRRASRLLRSAIGREGPTILHAGRWLPEGLLAWWMSRKTGIPYICYAHGEEVNCRSGDGTADEPSRRIPTVYGSRELGLMASWVLGNARAVIANSENTRSILMSCWKLAPEAVRCLHPGVDVDRFRPATDEHALRREMGWQDKLVVLTVGRLQERKGQATMIEALPRLLRRFPNLMYVVVGDGEELPRLRQLVADLDLAEHVRLLREINDQELVRCYQGCDLFILPNRAVGADIEGFGMVLLEAQACGKAVVAGRSGGTREAMLEGTSGETIDCESAEVLTAGLEDLLGNPARRMEMGARGRAWVVRNFGWESLSRKAADLFAELSP